MSLWSDLWDEALDPTKEASSAAWNRRSQVLGTQIEDALKAHGDGVVGENEFLVTAGAGLSVNIAAGDGVADTTTGFVAFRASQSYNLSGLPANEAAVYIYVGAVICADPADPDSRKDNSIHYVQNTIGGPVANHILIAHCATNGTGIVPDSIVDDRTFIRGQEALNAIDELLTRVTDIEADLEEVKDDLGLGYWDVAGDPVIGEDPVHDRLNALEGSVGGVVYWGSLEKSSGDATTIAEYIAALLATSGGDGGGAGTATVVQAPSDIEISNHMRLVLRLMHALPEVEETQRYSYLYVPGISSNDLYDAVHTTCTVDPVSHRLG